VTDGRTDIALCNAYMLSRANKCNVAYFETIVAARSIIGYWYDIVVRPSVRLSVAMSTVAAAVGVGG